jgi:solute carrier family 25 ornithine transporter 2/15
LVLAREIPGYFCFFGAYEATRYFFTKEGQSKDDIGLTKTALSGAIGGLSFWTIIYPADVVKSKIQVQGGTLSQILMEIVKRDGKFFAVQVYALLKGLRGFYKGLTPTLIRYT